MSIAALISDLMEEHGTACHIKGPADAAPRPVVMLVNATSSGGIHSRYSALSFVDKSTLQRGADWGYGLLLGEDAPEDMEPQTRLIITDSLGGQWECEAAKAITEINPETRCLYVVAWRLALRGKQRAVRR